MKKIFFLLSVLLLFTACQPDLKEVIIGKWSVSDIQIKNLDEVVQKFYSLQKDDLQQRIDYYKQFLDTISDEASKIVYQQNIAELQSELENLNTDSIKNNILNYSKENTKEFVFNSDNTFSYILINLGGIEESGNWKISDDNKTLTIKTMSSSIDYNIDSFDENTLVLSYSEKNGDVELKFQITLTKKE